MGSSGVLLGQILLVASIMLLGFWFSTQWAAAQLGYQIRLGVPWFELRAFPFITHGGCSNGGSSTTHYEPVVFQRAGVMAASSGIVATLCAVACSVTRSRQTRPVTTFGSARWATYQELTAAGLTRHAGVFLGRTTRKYLRHDGPEHVMAFAPTRSGKGVGLVVPTLLTWPHSVVVHDIKGEKLADHSRLA